MINRNSNPRRKGSRTRRVLRSVLVTGFILVSLFGAGIYLLNDDVYRRLVIWSADYFFDSQLEIDGAFSVGFGREVELNAENVSLKANDGSFKLSLGKLNLKQRFGSYLSTGTLWINHLEMEDLRGEIMETSAGQEFDWRGFSLPYVVIEKVQLRNLSLAYPGIDQQRHSLELSHVSLDDTNNQGPVKVSAAGVINARPLRLEGTLGSLEQLFSNEATYPIDFILSSDTGDAGPDQPVINLDGSVGRARSGATLVQVSFDVALTELLPIFDKGIIADEMGYLRGSASVAENNRRWGIKDIQFAATDTDMYQLHFDGAVDDAYNYVLNGEIEVPDPANLGARFGIDLSGYAPYKGKGTLSGNREKANYEGHASIGRINSDATLSISLVGGKPFLEGKFTIPEFYLEDIGLDHKLGIETDVAETENSSTGEPAGPEAAARGSVDNQYIFDREPIDLSLLHAFNLDLEILIEQIAGVDYSLDKLSGGIELTDGVLRASPMRFTFEGGTTDLEFAVDSRNTPSITIKATADHLMLGKLISRVQTEVPVKGKAYLDIDISGEGHSAHELAADLSGKVGFGLENARVPKKYMEYLNIDAFGWVLRMITFEDDTTPVDCLMVNFDVDQGVAKTNLLLADGPHLFIDGSMTLDLGQETVDMMFSPKQKQRVGPDFTTVKVTGPMLSPNVETSSEEAMAARVGALVVLPQIVIPVALIEKLWTKASSRDEEGKGCTELIEKHETGQLE